MTAKKTENEDLYHQIYVANIQMPCGNFMLITNNYTIKFTLQTSKCPAADAAHNGGT